MKKALILSITFIIIGMLTVLGQTKEQQRRADAYYQNQQTKQQNSSSWDSSFSSSNFKQNNLVNWEYDDGTWYSGQVDSKKNKSGFGTYKYSQGRGLFSGQYRNDKRNGYGIYVWFGKAIYFGQWKENSRSGIGTLLHDDGTIYNGSWKNSKQDGFGISHYPKNNPLEKNNYVDIVKYVGEYKQAEWDGYGILYFKDGTYKSGIWIDNVLSKELPKSEVLEALGF
ncbi:hypothetical protein [uncultured Kordia sp.]|uniref:hypothetical protein n=1 Tax=uncultured Kordia sp. TaxID=507699 RepID=UPI0026253CF2|nr:hypothetical protein [uncultured Kordia sp.]